MGLVCLRMHGIPRVPGRRAYSSVGREVGAVCGERNLRGRCCCLSWRDIWPAPIPVQASSGRSLSAADLGQRILFTDTFGGAFLLFALRASELSW